MTALTWTQRYYAPAVAKLPVAEPGSFEGSGRTYPSLSGFVRADVRRLRAPERDFGLRWLERGSDHLYRAAWNEGTGELYIVQTGSPENGGGHVEVLGYARNVDEVERALAGWRSRVGGEGSLEWLKDMALERLSIAAISR